MADSKSKFAIKIGLLKKVNILKVSFYMNYKFNSSGFKED